MKKYIFLGIATLGLLAYAQGQQKSYTLTTPDNMTKEYIARDYVVFQPGYSFTAGSGKALRAAIDEHLLVNASYQSQAEIPNPDRALNTNYMVGSTVGNVDVSPTGAATYTIPIETPVGINGMQPNLSFGYNSQSGNGLLGYGWNLSATSAISRTGKTIYHDGATAATTLTNNDNLVFDGQRLLLISGNNLTAEAKYRTEIETFSDISCKIINGKTCFEVQTKDGRTMQYGATEDSYIEAQGTSTAISWLLSKVIDANGNYLTYHYEEDNSTGSFFLKRIEYTGNEAADVSPVNKVEFFYEKRNDVEKGYTAGRQTSLNVLLKSIRTSTSGSKLKEYKFEYYNDGFYSKLTEIVEEAADGSRYNSTVVDWGSDRGMVSFDGEERRMHPISSFDYENRIYADFNGDSRIDFISFPKKSLDQYTEWDYVTSYAQSLYLYGATGYHQISLGIGFQGMHIGDFNGDGLMDVVKINKSGTQYKYTIFLYNGDSFVESYNFSTTSEKCLIADFDGDGKADIYTGSILWRNGTLATSGGVTISDNVLSGNFLGNGKTNLLSGNEIYELVGNYFSMIQNGTWTTGTRITGDFNGDGKTDVLVITNATRYSSETYCILFATGTGFLQHNLPSLNITGKCLTGDFNRDGKTDIVFADARSKSGQTYPIKVGLFDGNNFQFTNYTTGILPTAANDTEMDNIWKSGLIVVADLDGDGRSELLYDNHRPSSNIKLFPDNQQLFVRSVTDGLNRKISFAFATVSTDENNFYNKADYGTAPIIKGNIPLAVLTYLWSKAGEDTNLTHYEYGKMFRHSQGKGILCFDEMRTYNYTLGSLTTVNYDYDKNYFSPFIKKQTVGMGSTNILETEFTNAIHTFSEKGFLPYTSKSVEKDLLTRIIRTTETMINTDGNITRSTVDIGGEINTTTNYSYIYAQGNGTTPNRIQNITTTNTIGDGSQTRQKVFEYDSKGNLTKETTDAGDVNQMIMAYTNFDAFGHPRSVTNTANGQTRTSKVAYTQSGRFAQSQTDVLGETISFNWNEAKGLLNSQTTRVGTTAYNYDGMGKLTNTTYPDGTQASVSQQWASENNESRLFYTHTQASGVTPVNTWYNAAGQSVLQESYGLNGNKISIFTEYFPNGQLKRISEPTFSSSPTAWDATYTYDSYGRISTQATPAGTTTYGYSGLVSTVQSPSGSRTTTLNNAGQVSSVSTNGQEVSYTYYPSGLIKTTTPAGGQPISMEYDLQGNRIRLTDPDAGVVRSAYNGFGELLWTRQKVHLTSDSITTSYTYTAAGLPQTIVRNGETTTYTYDNKNRPSTISIAGQHKQTFTYDNFDRITNLKEEIGNRVYNIQTSYDNMGRIKRETYPSGYYTENHYDGNGYLTSVTDTDSRLIWKVEAENIRGQVTREKRGDMITSNSYNTKGQLTNSNNDVFDWSYGYNNKENLQWRDDTNMGESFTYDQMNRLTTWDIYQNDVLLKTNSISYDANSGNIAAKSDVGFSAMEYGADSKPHALGTHSLTADVPTSQSYTYTDFRKLKTIMDGDKLYRLTYGVDDQRRKSEYYEDNDILKQTRYYLGNYEEEIDAQTNNIRKIHYLYGGGILIRNNGQDSLFFAYKDHLGSIVALSDYSGNLLERYAFDPWGNRRNPDDWKAKDTRTHRIINRGFTGHEHLDKFGIIDMNGRVYDPLTAQFMQPDPFVQAPDNWLNFNRYAYAMNNPMGYVDPSGEFIEWIIAGVAILAFTYLKAAHDNTPQGKDKGNPGNWQWNPVKWFDKGSNGVSVSVSYNFDGGATFGATYYNNKLNITGGVSVTDNSTSLGGGILYDGYGLSYYRTKFKGEQIFDGEKYQHLGSQTVGEIGLHAGGISVRVANDVGLLGDNNDRWRSSAVEIGIGAFVMGKAVYTNAPYRGDKEGDKEIKPVYDTKYKSRIYGKSGIGAYADSEVYSSPFYMGHKQGNNVLRIGINHPAVQDIFQNGMHLLMRPQSPLFYTPYGKYSSRYFYSGYHNPYSLY